MSRLALVVAAGSLFTSLGLGACSKSAAKQEKPDEPMGKVEVPGARGAPTGTVVGGPAADTATDKAGNDARFRLSAEEGQLAIVVPAGAVAGSEAIAKIVVTPGSEYKVNTEFPTKLTLETPDGVTLAKAELKAGGHDKAKGDAEQFDESNLTFAVKLTPGKTGSYTINGSFKFAVCDKAGSTCLAKKEPIEIQVAAQ